MRVCVWKVNSKLQTIYFDLQFFTFMSQNPLVLSACSYRNAVGGLHVRESGILYDPSFLSQVHYDNIERQGVSVLYIVWEEVETILALDYSAKGSFSRACQRVCRLSM